MKGARPDSPHRWASLATIPILIFILLGLLLKLGGMDGAVRAETPGLWPLLHFIFLFACPLLVAYVAVRGYLAGGSASLLMLAHAVFVFAMGSLLGAVLLRAHGPNASVTMHSASLLLAGVLHCFGAAFSLLGGPVQSDPRRRQSRLLVTLVGVSALLGILTFSLMKDALPVFFIPGQSPTHWRQTVLALAALSFLCPGAVYAKLYAVVRSRYLYWYALALLLIATGLGSLLIQRTFGSPVGWVGRTAQYLANLYLIVAVLRRERELQTEVVRVDELLADVFQGRFQLLLEERTAQLSAANEQLRLEIEKHHRTEQALRQSESRSSTFFRASLVPAAISRVADELFVDANDAFLNVFGYTRDEVLGHTSSELGLWHLPQERARAMEILREGGCMRQLPAKFRKKSGEVGDALVSAEYIEFNGERYILSTLLDITERTQAEAEKQTLEALNRQLQKVESLGRMAGAIAHRFNNQFQVIIGNLERAGNALAPGTLAQDSVTRAMYAAREAAKLSGSMLTYLGQTPGQRQPVDLSVACAQWLPALTATLPRGVLLESDLAHPGPAIAADVNQMQQVMINLLTNAWESFDGNPGTIHVSVRTALRADIAAAGRFPVDWQPQDDAYACLEVADGGCGIADGDIHKLFDPFFSTKFTGRGMGLAVVRGIVRAHGGGITVASNPGEGSIFRVYIPLTAEPVPCKSSQADDLVPATIGATILLIEDERPVRELAAMMLQELGHTVIQAGDGPEAVEIFRQREHEISCVLCDLTMPRMNGWETLAVLRTLSPDIPVALASGYDEVRVMAGEHAELPQAFLGKPYEFVALRNAIGVALAGRN